MNMKSTANWSSKQVIPPPLPQPQLLQLIHWTIPELKNGQGTKDQKFDFSLGTVIVIVIASPILITCSWGWIPSMKFWERYCKFFLKFLKKI